MNTPKSTECKEFFYNERIARIWLVLFALYCVGWSALLVLGVLRPLQTIPSLLGVAIFPTSYFVWLIWLGRRYPIFTLSERLVEWREPESRKRSSIRSPDIIHVEKVTTQVIVLKTTSKGSIRIALGGLSLQDRQEIKELVESQFGVGEEGGQYTHRPT